MPHFDHANTKPVISHGDKDNSALLERLGILYAIFQAPMGGGPGTPELAAAVSSAGGLGWLGSNYDPPEKIRADIQTIRSLTDKPFGVNLFSPDATNAPEYGSLQPALDLLAPYYRELNLSPPQPPAPPAYTFEEQMEVVLQERVPVFSFTMGLLRPPWITALHKQGTLVFGTATTVGESVALAELEVDGIIAQGTEAGAHRGSFQSAPDNFIGLFALLPRVVAAVDLPVIASGGIMDGEGIAAALIMGASAVQMGTAFLLADESGASENYKRAVLDVRPEKTKITCAFSGREARGIVNRFMREIESSAVPLPPFPIMNALTQPLRRAARSTDNTELMSLWCGQNGASGRRMPAAELMQTLVQEMRGAGYR